MIVAELFKKFWPELLAIVVIGIAVFAFHKFTESLDAKGYARGVLETKAEYVNRDNVALKEALAAQHQAEINAAAADARATAAQTLASTNYQKGVKDGKTQTEQRIAAVNNGSLRLRDPAAKALVCPAFGDSAGKAQVARPAGGGDGQAGGELSTTASEFLLRLTGEADQIARQLGLAQAVIISDREMCNSP